ncbi:acetyltransferase [Chryseobacterium sp. TY4]
MKNIAIFGAGGFGREVKLIIDAINKHNPHTYKLLGFFDDAFPKGKLINGLPILGGLTDLNNFSEDLAIAISIGEPQLKKKIINKINNKQISYPSLIHPNCSIGADEVFIGEGTIICEGTILTCNIQIGNFAILNLYCTVGHDVTIGDYSSFMPSVNISGEVLIENAVYVGTGAKIINRLSIGENTIVGAGAIVSKSLPSNCTAVGIPAKPIKFH